MDALLRVDNASNREQTKQDLQELTKDLQGIKIENGFRENELKVKISYNTSQKPARATDWTSDLKKAIRSDAVNYFISKNKISGCETLSVNGKDVLLKVSKEQKNDVMNAFNASANSMGITFKDSPKDNQVRVTVEI
ncbi:hypothetical protein C1141_12775 [Vibrio agarivorans]|nr:hypothetical protein C1141_12775 [Vibrio agarivorans]